MDKKGFSLVELLVVITLMGVVLLPISAYFQLGLRNAVEQSSDIETLTSVNQGYYVMSRLVRNHPPVGVTPTRLDLSDPNSSYFELKGDAIVYNNGSYDREIIKNVDNLTFTSTLNDTGDIVSIDISIDFNLRHLPDKSFNGSINIERNRW